MKKYWKYISITVFFVVLLAGVLTILETQKIKKESLNSWSSDDTADCAIVLTGGAGRIREGIALLSQKRIKKLIISGVHQDSELRDIFPQWPLFGELSEKDVILERRSGTTYGNAQQTLDIVEALRCRDVLLITSQLHMARAYKTFVASYPPSITILKHTIVSSHNESQWNEILIEALKSIFYSLWAT
jgi:uncharacterized SAM-binding protein YcdF (DUF218 family)